MDDCREVGRNGSSTKEKSIIGILYFTFNFKMVKISVTNRNGAHTNQILIEIFVLLPTECNLPCGAWIDLSVLLLQDIGLETNGCLFSFWENDCQIGINGSSKEIKVNNLDFVFYFKFN